MAPPKKNEAREFLPSALKGNAQAKAKKQKPTPQTLSSEGYSTKRKSLLDKTFGQHLLDPFPRQSFLSRASIAAASFGGDQPNQPPPTDHAFSFSSHSLARDTWGITSGEAIPANQKKRKSYGNFFVGRKTKRTRRDKDKDITTLVWDDPPTFKEEVEEEELYAADEVAQYKANIFTLPLEIRWMIYRHLLTSTRPVLLHSNWTVVLRPSNKMDLSILQVCRQLHAEAHHFLYSHNTFRAMVNISDFPTHYRAVLEDETSTFITPKYKHLMKSVIVDLMPPKPKWMPWIAPIDPKYLDQTAECLNYLLIGKARLDSLVILVSPKVITSQNSSLQNVTYSDFFGMESKIMKVLLEIPCLVLTLILRLGKHMGKTVLSVDMRKLDIARSKATSKSHSTAQDTNAAGSTGTEESWLSNNKLAKVSREAGVEEVMTELRALRARFEQIVRNPYQAIEQGLARWMRDDEDSGDGLKLTPLKRRGSRIEEVTEESQVTTLTDAETPSNVSTPDTSTTDDDTAQSNHNMNLPQNTATGLITLHDAFPNVTGSIEALFSNNATTISNNNPGLVTVA